MWNQVINTPTVTPLLQWQGLQILPGLNAVTGDEGSGKTRLLRELSDNNADAVWLDLRLPEHDEHTPEEVWSALRAQHPDWNADLQNDLADALQLCEHLGKRLFMLSAGSRRKVALVGLLASGATITCLDQPYAALDLPSVRVLREFLQDMSDHPTRAWVVADYEADPQLPWHCLIERH
jgi:ABC-type transport system involved in cytochrome c biogenesis ATPase subunit